MKPALEDYFKDIPIDDHTECKDNIFLHHDLFTDMMNEAVCIIDFQKRNFHDISDHGFLLGGYARSEVKNMGYQFFNKIIHPDYIQLWVNMHNTILKYLHKQDFEVGNVHYFTCTIPIKSCFQLSNTPHYMMSDVRLRPVFVNQILKYGLCFFSASTIKTPGNLRVYFKEKKIYSEYSFATKKWIDCNMLTLTLREREILMLTQQDLKREEKASTLFVSDTTIKNTINKLIKKSNVKNMIQIESYATTHRLIYYNKTTKQNPSKGKDKNRD